MKAVGFGADQIATIVNKGLSIDDGVYGKIKKTC